MNQGNLSATIYNASTGGTLLYSDTFLYAINNSFFDVMLGAAAPLNLIYGENYWLDISVNGQDINWSASNRLKFYSSVGNVTTGISACSGATICNNSAVCSSVAYQSNNDGTWSPCCNTAEMSCLGEWLLVPGNAAFNSISERKLDKCRNFDFFIEFFWKYKLA